MNQRAPHVHVPRSAVDIASACSRLGTWGLGPELREELLAERAADLAAQLADPARNSFSAIAGRAMRTLLGDVGRRITSRHNSSLPLAFALLALGFGALLYAALTAELDYRLALLLEGTGLLILAITGLRFPLVIQRYPSAIGSLLVGAGCAMAVEAIPFTAEVSLFYYTALTAISLSAIGFLALATVLLTGRDRTPRIPGSILVAAAGLLAFSEIGSALFIFDQNAMEAAAAVLVGGGAILFIRFFARLRYLPVHGRPGTAST